MSVSFVRCGAIAHEREQLPVVFKRFLLDVSYNVFMEKFCQTSEQAELQGAGRDGEEGLGGTKARPCKCAIPCERCGGRRHFVPSEICPRVAKAIDVFGQ